ncbi:alpha/beta fold hydrolase BchO [Chromatocurvus halotolerans]|uniref:Magnesium chelatase accessory protein n=1 Tax=Chromatocurvus halotolerans TaxID=1132028 RepID=A0A4R2KW14_9GAMM|nr:alpha/beta fold hydrolase BchO [Chromatocurvus halotolerans]TCO77172.1 magnesium chelatase accessory protein [Chromatocurvus halotolerans]
MSGDLAEIHDEWPNRTASRYVEAGGLRWHVQELGTEGPELLLLHGTGAATHSWAGMAPLLAQHFRVIAPDLPGHGYTDPAARGQQSLPGMAALVASLLDALGVEPKLVVGHSAGAAVLIRMTLDGLIRPAAIVSFNGALLPFEGLMGKVFPRAARALAALPILPGLLARRARRSPMVDRLIEQTGSQSASLDLVHYQSLSQSPRHIRGVLAMMANWDLATLEQDLLELDTPLYLVACVNDRAVPAAQARFLKARLACARLRIVHELGHLGHEEDPAQFVGFVEEAAAEVGLLG